MDSDRPKHHRKSLGESGWAIHSYKELLLAISSVECQYTSNKDVACQQGGHGSRDLYTDRLLLRLPGVAQQFVRDHEWSASVVLGREENVSQPDRM